MVDKRLTYRDVKVDYEELAEIVREAEELGKILEKIAEAILEWCD